jgi:hypothetical protein
MKDRFSSGSQLYQLARPSYPASLIQEILKHVATPQFAWDCGRVGAIDSIVGAAF